jgi:Fe(3+) dicitrate transport protein
MISIPDQPLGEALTQIGQQARVNILFAPASVQGLQAHALYGQMNARQALNELLRGTHLAVVPDGSGFLVAPDPAKTARRIAAAKAPETKNI